VFTKSHGGIYRAIPFEAFDWWLRHGFGSRECTQLDVGGVATLKQTHSANVVAASALTGSIGEGDALITEAPGAMVGVKTADCLPILLVDPQERAVGAVHAGWRGTVANVAGKTVEKMGASFGTKGEALHAAIGPGIGVCCYEVGPEVAVQFQSLFPERNDLDRRTHIDLVEANRRQLLAAGLLPARIYVAGLCTACTGAEFHSFRRDGEKAGRMLSIVGLR
jgi:YfiH family protein